MTLPASIPVRRDGDTGATAFLSGDGSGLVLAVLFAAGAAWLAWLAWRRRRAGAAGGRPAVPGLAGLGRLFEAPGAHGLRVVHSARLTPRHSVHEVQWQGRHFLLACAEQGVRLVAEAQVSAEHPPGEGAAP